MFLRLTALRKGSLLLRYQGMLAVLFLAFSGSVVYAQNQEEPLLPVQVPKSLDKAKVALGRSLFHDRRLSRDNSISCASCHNLAQGGADAKARSIGVGRKVGEINTPTVFNSSLNFRQYWDGRSSSLEDQISGPVHNPAEMGTSWPEVLPKLQVDAQLNAQFKAIYNTPPTVVAIKDAIAEFERSLITPSRMDRWLQGDATALDARARAGYYLFKRHGCVACHQGVNVGGNLYQRFGLMRDYFANKKQIDSADLGRFNVTGREDDRHVFKVPGLRNVALTAPYFHDGSALTLEDAVAQMGLYQLGVALPKEEVEAIVSFLRALTGEQLE